jgi:prepilin-type N-terminal cleavage/methylation domain-containing protein
MHKEPSVMNRHSNVRRQDGFTLVEIAIVLMIVGLLIGGILRGQELIQSARVRNIIDQKSAIQTAYIGFMDRYRMLPGDLTVAQAGVVGNNVIASAGGGDGQLALATESTLFFQNLTAAGFISCGGCMTFTVAAAAAGPAPTINNSPVNVYGERLMAAHEGSDNTAVARWFDASATSITRMVLRTGGSIPSKVLAEVDRKADDGLPGTGQFRYSPGASIVAICAPTMIAAPTVGGWANPSQVNCQGAWLF